MPRKVVDGARIAALGREGKTVAEIIAECGVSKTTVLSYLVQNGVPRVRKRRSKIDETRLRELLVTQCLSLREAAVVLGMSDTAVYKAAKRHGIATRSKREAKQLCDQRGRGRAKLGGRVEALRADRASGLTYAECGRRYGLSPQAARAAADGEAWGHIPVVVCATREQCQALAESEVPHG